MAIGLRARYDAAADPGFQKLVAQALAETAVTVYNETPQPANHPARAAYAVLVITDPPLSMVSIKQPGHRRAGQACLRGRSPADYAGHRRNFDRRCDLRWRGLGMECARERLGG